LFKTYLPEAEFALQAVRTAAKLCRQIQAEMISESMSKLDQSPVTVADFASQAVVGRMLEDIFPGEVLVAEEDSTALKDADRAGTLRSVTESVSKLFPQATTDQVCAWIDKGMGDPEGRFWVLDPIDGTKGFLRGDQYVVALALVEDGIVVLGALGCPNLSEDLRPDLRGAGAVVVAARGEGVWVTGMESDDFKPIRVSERSDPVDARVLRSYAAEHTDTTKIDQLVATLSIEQPPVLMDSAAKYAILASGGGDLLFRLLSPHRPDYVENIWDQAAGSILVEEAGGRVTDLAGVDLDFSVGRHLSNNCGVLASNGLLHEAALEALRRVGADRRP
jgi:3'(2'), 5'-bisphosphate nucleotidase